MSLETAVRAFADLLLLMVQDRFESGEHRWQNLAMVDDHLVLLVAHTVGEDDDGTEVLRIISARKAESKERKRYEQDREI